ncbi:2-hydroxyacylsphingosine 1-beta-galactosyltransferase-like [Glandiceps talaboti]
MALLIRTMYVSLIVALLKTTVPCSKILSVPVESVPGSIFMISSKIARDLAERGHDVTLLVSSIYHSAIVNFTDVSGVNVESFYLYSNVDDYNERLSNLATSGKLGWYNIFESLYVMSWECDAMFADQALLTRLKSMEFDLIVSHSGTPCAALLAHYLDRPFVLVLGNRVLTEWDAFMYNVPSNLAYTPCIGVGLTDKMSFFERVYNSVYFVMKYISYNILLATYGRVKHKYNIKPHLSIHDVFVDAELFLYNTDLTLHFPRPLMPNVISLGGGYFIKPVLPLQKVGFRGLVDGCYEVNKGFLECNVGIQLDFLIFHHILHTIQFVFEFVVLGLQ